MTQNYRVGQAFTQQPMDLSNYLFIRTRERLLFENKVKAPQRVNKSGKVNALTDHFSVKSLTNINEDLTSTLPKLQNMLYVLQPQQHNEDEKLTDLPVAFASNALYVLERNGATQREAYEKLLLPILRKKAEYLHAEGVAQTIWALANAELVEDAALWGKLR